MKQQENKSDLEKALFYEDKSKEQAVYLFPIGIFVDKNLHTYFSNYELKVKNNGEEASVEFEEHKAIINCFYKNKKQQGTMSIKEFNEMFLPIVKRLFSKEVYNKYLKSLDMGKEGIFRETAGHLWL